MRIRSCANGLLFGLRVLGVEDSSGGLSMFKFLVLCRE